MNGAHAQGFRACPRHTDVLRKSSRSSISVPSSRVSRRPIRSPSSPSGTRALSRPFLSRSVSPQDPPRAQPPWHRSRLLPPQLWRLNQRSDVGMGITERASLFLPQNEGPRGEKLHRLVISSRDRSVVHLIAYHFLWEKMNDFSTNTIPLACQQASVVQHSTDEVDVESLVTRSWVQISEKWTKCDGFEDN